MADSESVDIKAPEFPESVADGEVATWHVQIGEAVQRDQVIVDIETDKVVLEVVAPADGKLIAIIKEEGETVLADELLATFEAGDGAGGSTVPAAVLSDMDETSESRRVVRPLENCSRAGTFARSGRWHRKRWSSRKKMWLRQSLTHRNRLRGRSTHLRNQ